MVRRRAVIALLGVAASLVMVVWMNRPHSVAPPSIRMVAIGQRIQGQPVILHESRHPAVPQALTASSSVYAGDLIQTDDMSRAALLAADGSSVRIDRATRLRFLAPAVIEIIEGRTYVATSNGSHGFEVRTMRGAVRDRGTQFEVRVTESALRVRVRSGSVELGHGAGITRAEAGTEAMVTSMGIAVRRVAPYGPEWTWTTDVAPSFAIEGRSLRAFLEHLAGEEGWTLRYADGGVAEAAGRTILHGSIEGLQAEQALGVGLATSELRYRLRGGELLVSNAAHAR